MNLNYNCPSKFAINWFQQKRLTKQEIRELGGTTVLVIKSDYKKMTTSLKLLDFTEGLFDKTYVTIDTDQQ